MNVTEKLVALSKRSRVQADEIAKIAGVSRATGYNWLDGSGLPSLNSALKLSRFFGVSLEVIADDELPLPGLPDPMERVLAEIIQRIGTAEAINRLLK